MEEMLLLIVLKFIEQIITICDEDIKIATIAGRYYTWIEIIDGIEDKRLLMLFRLLNPKSNSDILTYLNDSHKNEIFDEFIVPNCF